MYRTLACVFGIVLTVISTHAQPRKFHFSEMKMGSPFNIILLANDSAQAARLAEKSFALVDSFSHIYSDYDSTSEVSKFSVNGLYKQKLSPALWDIFMRSREAYLKSKSAYDITIGPLSLLWRRSRKGKIFPEKQLVIETRKKIGFNQLRMDETKHTVQMMKAGMRIDLGGIAKGYIAQKIIDFLKKNGITQALADAGGDMVMSNPPDGSSGWIIGVNVPETTDELLPKKLVLHNMAVATSGDAYQYIEWKGIKYSHIIDPRTGYGITSQRNVTVIAKNGTDADWLATACSILPIADAKKLARSMHAELLITLLDHEKIIYHSTRGFAGYWKP